MEENTPDVRERLSKLARMGQEPKDRLWAVVIVLALVVFALGGLLVETRLFLSGERGLGYERNAIDCLEIVVDNDRNFSLPAICFHSQVIVHYPPEVCTAFFINSDDCGIRWEE